MIACVRIPHFVAGIHRTAVQLAMDKPAVVTRRGKVIASCAIASQQRVVPGQTTRQAQAILPQAVYFSVQDERINCSLLGVLDCLAVFTPLVEYHKPIRRDRPQPVNPEQTAVFYVNLENLNLSDSRTLMDQMQRDLRGAIGLEVSLGLAANLFTAFAASHVEKMTVVPAGKEGAFLAALPITLLPLTQEQRYRLTMLGLTTIRQIAALPLSGLMAQFGKHGLTLYRLARGWDERRVLPHRFDVVERVMCEFDTPVSSRAPIEAVLHNLASDLSKRLQAKGSMGRTLTLTLHLEGGKVLDTQSTPRQPVSDAFRLAKTLLQLFARFKSLRQGVIGVEVTMTNVVPFAGTQLDLFAHRSDQRERLEQALASLTLRYDDECFFWILPADKSAQRIEQRYRLQSAARR